MIDDYVGAGDDAVLAACQAGEPEAIAVLMSRHGILAELGMLRERAGMNPREVGMLLVARLSEHPDRFGDFAPSQSTLRAFLAVISRRHAEKARLPLVAPPPTPGPLDVVAAREAISSERLAQAAKETIARQPPNVTAILRMRLHGLSPGHIAALVGTSEARVVSALEWVAQRLGALESEISPERIGEHDDLTLAFRVLLDASPPPERVRFARRTESERPLAKLRAQVDAAMRSLKSELLTTPAPGVGCLSPSQIAGYVDGTTRGAFRARAESHVAGCAACLDEIAALSCDLRALPLVRDALSADRGAQLAAMAIGIACFDAGTQLADAVASRRDNKSARMAADLARLGRACRALEGGTSAAQEREMSGLVSRDVPSDDEAPVVAFEALALGDSGSAFRAIDETNARSPVAARVRVLAAAAGGDAPLGHAWARAVKDGYDVDPGAVEDAECVLSIGEGVALPREIVVERLRALVPDLVRVVLALHARPTR